MRRAVTPGAVPLLPPSQLRPLLRAARPGAAKPTLPEGRPGRTCLPRRALQNAGPAWPERWGQGAARRCVTSAWRRNSVSVPGLGGRRLPAARRNSALVAARSHRSRSQAPGRRSRSACLAAVFRGPGPSLSEEHLDLGAASSSQPRPGVFPGHCGPLRCRPSPRTRPTCPLLVRVKSLMRLPGRASLRLHDLFDGDREELRRPEPARPSSPLAFRRPTRGAAAATGFLRTPSGWWRLWREPLAVRESESLTREARIRQGLLFEFLYRNLVGYRNR